MLVFTPCSLVSPCLHTHAHTGTRPFMPAWVIPLGVSVLQGGAAGGRQKSDPLHQWGKAGAVFSGVHVVLNDLTGPWEGKPAVWTGHCALTCPCSIS